MRLTLALALAGLMTMAAFAQGQRGPGTPPKMAIVKSFDGTTLVADTEDGPLTATVTSSTRISENVPKTLADIKPGDFIASGGTVGADGKLRANEIRIFSAPGGEGQFPMQQPGQTMTNATVTQVMTNATVKDVSSDGLPVIKLTFHGAGAPGSANCTGRSSDAPGGPGTGCVGETQFEVPANVKVTAIVNGDPSMLKAGTKISINVASNPDGTVSASRITIIP